MVGVRISNRCDNCRRRKKKCDEKKPSCSGCIRGGWTCPGYGPQWKFVDESRRLAQHNAEKKDTSDSNDLARQEPWLKNSREDLGNGGSQHGSNLQYSNNQMCALTNVPRYHETNRLGSALVYCLETQVKESLVPLITTGSFFQFIPARLGYNPALDDAVSCLSAIYCESPLILYSAHRGICQAYGKALSSLRTCLGDNSVRMEPETLCASILLQLCELALNAGKGEWSNLARGSSFLLYSRGAHRYKTAFEHAMLESQLPFVLGQSLKNKEHCFLSGLEWQALLGQGPIWPFHTEQAQSLSLRSRIYAIIVELPSLIIHSLKMIENKICPVADQERLDLLISKSFMTLEKMKGCPTVDVETIYMSSISSSENVPEAQVNYPDILAGVLDGVANTTILSIKRIIRSLYDVRLRSRILLEPGSHSQLENSQFLDSPEITERRRQRVTNAFKFVQGKSMLAAKPLEFGIRLIQSTASTSTGSRP